jgi:hypothetical protein
MLTQSSTASTVNIGGRVETPAPLAARTVTDVHQYLDPHGERTVPELHAPDALSGDWLTLGPAEDDPRVV